MSGNVMMSKTPKCDHSNATEVFRPTKAISDIFLNTYYAT